MLSQIPKIIFTILKENRWLRKIVKDIKLMLLFPTIDLECTIKKFHVFILRISFILKQEIGLAEFFAQKIHYFFIKKYHICWVPDFKENGLGGTNFHILKKFLHNADLYRTFIKV